MLRGIRGATTVSFDSPDEIVRATRVLLTEMAGRNGVHPDDVAAILFTVTPDLTQAFPAAAARDMGWNLVPLLDCQAPAVPGSLPRCIRVLMLWNTDRPSHRIRHIYLGEARSLRPDLAPVDEGDGDDGHRDAEDRNQS